MTPCQDVKREFSGCSSLTKTPSSSFDQRTMVRSKQVSTSPVRNHTEVAASTSSHTTTQKTQKKKEMILPMLLIQLLLPISDAFFPIAPSCGCPPMHPACPPNPACPARDVPLSQQMQPIVNVPDELEMRAAAFGIPIGQRVRAPTNLEQFEKLVERQEAIFAATAQPAPPSEPLDQEDDMSVGLGSQSERRRAPAIHFSKQEDSTTSTASTNAAEADIDQLLPTTAIPVASSKCNSQVLKKIMLDNISPSSSESKRKINVAAEAQFGGNVDVICSRGHFSYVFSSNLYCETSKDLVTCIAFRQTATS